MKRCPDGYTCNDANLCVIGVTSGDGGGSGAGTGGGGGQTPGAGGNGAGAGGHAGGGGSGIGSGGMSGVGSGGMSGGGTGGRPRAGCRLAGPAAWLAVGCRAAAPAAGPAAARAVWSPASAAPRAPAAWPRAVPVVWRPAPSRCSRHRRPTRTRMQSPWGPTTTSGSPRPRFRRSGASPRRGTITEFPTLTANASPGDIVSQGGFLWFFEDGLNKIAKCDTNGTTLAEFPIMLGTGRDHGMAGGGPRRQHLVHRWRQRQHRADDDDGSVDTLPRPPGGPVRTTSPPGPTAISGSPSSSGIRSARLAPRPARSRATHPNRVGVSGGASPRTGRLAWCSWR